MKINSKQRRTIGARVRLGKAGATSERLSWDSKRLGTEMEEQSESRAPGLHQIHRKTCAQSSKIIKYKGRECEGDVRGGPKAE